MRCEREAEVGDEVMRFAATAQNKQGTGLERGKRQVGRWNARADVICLGSWVALGKGGL